MIEIRRYSDLKPRMPSINPKSLFELTFELPYMTLRLTSEWFKPEIILNCQVPSYLSLKWVHTSLARDPLAPIWLTTSWLDPSSIVSQ